VPWAPDQQRTAKARCAASGARDGDCQSHSRRIAGARHFAASRL